MELFKKKPHCEECGKKIKVYPFAEGCDEPIGIQGKFHRFIAVDSYNGKKYEKAAICDEWGLFLVCSKKCLLSCLKKNLKDD